MVRHSKSNYNAQEGQLRLDALDAKIIDDLMLNADITSTEMSKKHKVPLSTIQRRRARIESVYLNKKYSLLPKLKNHRIARLMITTKNGSAESTAKEVYDSYPAISEVTIGINSSVNVTANLYFKDTEDLHSAMQNISAISTVSHVQFYEIVKIIGERDISLKWYLANRN